MSIDDTKEELFEYGRWASIKANRSMWYQPINHYPSNDKSDPICISLDRALFIDRVLSSVKPQDEKGYKVLTEYLVARKTYREIGCELKCSHTSVAAIVSNTICVVHGVIIAQDMLLSA